ncbi:MAG: gliding motility-associated C-terminal domain-containing protein [Lewinellaceae bacterium]|nr:gliding motility-associated C-terminal domain-containing protein [Lewinellaceae bacterium]
MQIIHNISRFFGVAIIVLFSLCIHEKANATHIVGGNITYKYIDSLTYQIKLTLRRDCYLGSPEAQFDPWASIGVYTGSGDLVSWLNQSIQVDSVRYGQLFLQFMSSDTLNEYIQSDCGFEGTQVCVHQTTYQGIIKLPAVRADGYIFAYQRCCRNATLANIQDPLETGATYWTYLSKEAMLRHNSSATFNQWPDVYICANKPLVFDHSATDIDGDSLVYKLSVPNNGATRFDPTPTPASNPPYDTVVWQNPYNMDNLLGGIPLKIDPKTGILTGEPNLVGQFLVGIMVEEYRNGKLIGVVRRDFQYNVRVCSPPPKADFTTSESKCSGLTVEFYNSSQSVTKHEWNFNYPSTDPKFISTEENPVFTFPSSGIYDVHLLVTRGTDGCYDTIVKKVSVFTNEISPDFDFRMTGCGDDKLRLTLTDKSVFNEPGYSLSKFEWIITQNGQTQTFTGKSFDVNVDPTGNIQVELNVTADNGCSTSLSKTIDIETLTPKIAFDYSLVGCGSDNAAIIEFRNGSATLNPYATISNAEWNINGSQYSGDVIQALISGNPTVTATLKITFVTDCSIELTKTFELGDLRPQAEFSDSPVNCPDPTSVKIKYTYNSDKSLGIGASDINWTLTTLSGVTTKNGAEVEFDIPKDTLITIRLQVTFENGCTDEVVKSYVPGPFATIKFLKDPIILCPGQSKYLITGGNSSWDYQWSPTDGLDLTDPSNPIVTIDHNITYQVTVSDGLCEVTGSVDVIALEGGVTLNVTGDNNTCDGSVSLNATGGIGAGQYTWSTDPNGVNVVGSGATLETTFADGQQTYYVIFEGESCSTTPAEFTVTNQSPNFEVFSYPEVCNNDTFKVIINNLNDNHINQYIWENNTHITNGIDTPNPTVVVDATERDPFTLIYTVTNQYGCSKQGEVTIAIRDNPTVDFTYDKPDCSKNEICFEIQGEFKPFVIWDFGDPTTTDDKSLEDAPCYTYPESGVYTVKLINIPGICPFVPVEKEITINPSLLLTVTKDTTICEGASITLVASSNIDDLLYTWKDKDGNVISTATSLEVQANGNTTYFVSAEDGFGCMTSDSVTVSEFVYDYSLSSDPILCFDNDNKIRVNIANPENYTFSWSPDGSIIQGQGTNEITVKPTEAVTYKVVITHKVFGCVSEKEITPALSPDIAFTLDVPNQFCFNQPVTITTNIVNPSGYTYHWEPQNFITNGATGPNPTVLISANQTFLVTVTDINTGCTKTASVAAEVANPAVVSINAEPDFSIYEGESLELFIEDPINGAQYDWSTGEQGTRITVETVDDTSYTVTVTDENGCTATDEVIVTVRKAKCDESDVYLPNAFTPNGDDANDVFIVRSHFIDQLTFIVYNRWGQEVFSTTDPNTGWDGKFLGRELEPDAYAYYIHVVCINGFTYTKKGNVTLIR